MINIVLTFSKPINNSKFYFAKLQDSLSSFSARTKISIWVIRYIKTSKTQIQITEEH